MLKFYNRNFFQNIISHARSLNEKQADVPQPLFIHENGEDVIVNLTKLTNGWENDGCQSQVGTSCKLECGVFTQIE